MTVVVNPAWSSDPGELITQAQSLFLKHTAEGVKKKGFSPPNLASPANMLPLIEAQLAWLKKFQAGAAAYDKTKNWADSLADFAGAGGAWFGGSMFAGIIYALPGSVAGEATRAVERFEGYVQVLKAAKQSGICLGDCAYDVTEPWLVGWYPGLENRRIPDVATPALIARSWEKGASVWASTVTDALINLPLDIAEEAGKQTKDAWELFRRIFGWIVEHPKTSIAIVAGTVGTVVAAPYVAPVVAAQIASRK